MIISKLRCLLRKLETFEAWAGTVGESRCQAHILIANCLVEEGQHQLAVELLKLRIETDTDRPHILYQQIIIANFEMAGQHHEKMVTLLVHIIRMVTIRARTGINVMMHYQKQQNSFSRLSRDTRIK